VDVMSTKWLFSSICRLPAVSANMNPPAAHQSYPTRLEQAEGLLGAIQFPPRRCGGQWASNTDTRPASMTRPIMGMLGGRFHAPQALGGPKGAERLN
jgi:hypothetical protein